MHRRMMGQNPAAYLTPYFAKIPHDNMSQHHTSTHFSKKKNTGMTQHDIPQHTGNTFLKFLKKGKDYTLFYLFPSRSSSTAQSSIPTCTKSLSFSHTNYSLSRLIRLPDLSMLRFPSLFVRPLFAMKRKPQPSNNFEKERGKENERLACVVQTVREEERER